MKDPELLEQCDEALKMLARVRKALPDALREAAEMSSPLRAASYDDVIVAGGRSVIWCWNHEREVHKCRRDELECGGEPIPLGDPTGEAAIMPGRVKISRQRIDAGFRAIFNAVPDLVAEVAWLTRTGETYQEAREREEKRRDLANENDARCRSCERTEVAPGVRRSEPVHRRTDGGGVYAEITPLCWWCYRFVFDTERTPTVEEVEKHHRGEKVRRKAS